MQANKYRRQSDKLRILKKHLGAENQWSLLHAFEHLLNI
jgi:hypothetical protein